MAVLGSEDVDTSLGLKSSSKKINTDNTFPLTGGETVVYGEALKLAAGKLLKMTATTDKVFAVANQDSDDVADSNIDYIISGSLIPSKIVVATGTIDDFRESFQVDTQIVLEKE